MAVEGIRGDMGWSIFKERMVKAGLRYRARLQRMDENRWARKVYEWNIKVEMWAGELGMFVRGVMRHGSMEVCKREINRRVEDKGKEEWRRGINKKSTVEWYRGKDQPRYESFYVGSLGEIYFSGLGQSH